MKPGSIIPFEWPNIPVVMTTPSLCLDFPMRPDFLAQIVVPRNMTKAEAERLCAFVMTLATDSATASNKGE